MTAQLRNEAVVMKENSGAKWTLLVLIVLGLLALGVMLWLMLGGAPNTPESIQL